MLKGSRLCYLEKTRSVTDRYETYVLLSPCPESHDNVGGYGNQIIKARFYTIVLYMVRNEFTFCTPNPLLFSDLQPSRCGNTTC